MASPQVQSHRTATVGKMFQRQHVCFRQIVHVNIVPDAGSIGCGIVGTEQFEFRTSPGYCLQC